MRRSFTVVVALVGVSLASSAAMAQTIAGQVTDNTGGILPGVTVEATSPALIEGSRVAFTDGAGRYTLIDLRPACPASRPSWSRGRTCRPTSRRP